MIDAWRSRLAAAWRLFFAMATLGLLVGSAAAQTTPGSGAPALADPSTAFPPFDSLTLTPGSLAHPPGVRAVPANPMIQPPSPRDAKYELQLSARFTEAGAEIKSGLQWRVFFDDPDKNGNLPLAADATDAAPRFRLSPGGYVVHAAYGLAAVSRHILVNGPSHEEFVVPAGALRLSSVVGDDPVPPEAVSFRLTTNEGGVERQVASNLRPGTLVRLPEGSYHVVSTYGNANAIVEVDVRVGAGRLVDATIHHKAATVNLKLVNAPNGEALPNTAWSVLTPGGDVVRESIGATPSLVLAEGNYEAVARNDNKSYTREFSVKAGQRLDVEIPVQ